MKTLALSANGEGFGHVARMASLVPALSRSYRLILYAPSATHPFLRDKLPDVASGVIPLRDIPCLSFVNREDRIDYSRTLRKNLPILLRTRTLIARLRNVMAGDGVDALLSDFEPYCAWAASALGIPVLQLNHPGIVTRSASIMPDALAAKLVARLMMGRWDKRLFVSFFDGDIGPMIRDELRSARRSDTGTIVVYLKPGYRNPVVRALVQLGITDYVLFPDPARDYASALASCKAVISGAGHQTLSEALFLGKPVLAIPQRGQYEQRLNAAMVEAGGFGTRGTMRGLPGILARFLREVDAGKFPKASRSPWIGFRSGDDTEGAVRRIHSFMQGCAGSRIVPYYSYVLGKWLGPADCCESDRLIAE